MSHEHAPEYRSSLPSILSFTEQPAVQHITPSDLLASPPRVTDPAHFVGRVHSGGLASPHYVVGEYRDGRMPTAFVLEYGDQTPAQTRSARVWGLAAHDRDGSSADYRLVHDDSSRGYVTA